METKKTIPTKLINEIICFYKKSKVPSILKTYTEFYHSGISREKIRLILKEAGMTKKGGDRYKYKEVILIPDANREFRYLTDKDLNFKEEIKSKLY
jgi:hypothetical protein